MKVLHLSYNDISGGAARAMYRLHESLFKKGIDSQLLVVNKECNKNNIVSIGLLNKLAIEILNFLTKKLTPIVSKQPREQTSYNLISPSVSKIINALQPDIVHLHWIGAGMASFSDLSKVNAPIVWTMHDMWPFTVGKHYVPDSTYFHDEQLSGEASADLFAKITLRQRQTFYTRNRCILVAPSQWLANEASNSALTRNQNIKVIQNTLDHNQYFAQDKKECVELLNLKRNKVTFSFGAISSEDDPRKGFQYLKKAIQNLSPENKHKVQLVVFGTKKKGKGSLYGIDVHYLGSVKEDDELRLIYCASDYFIAPSIQDNLPNTVVESLACGTPVIAFNVGGMPDLIKNDINGFLAERIDEKSLQKSLEKAIDTKFCGLLIHQNSKKLRDYDVISGEYCDLYRHVLD